MKGMKVGDIVIVPIRRIVGIGSPCGFWEATVSSLNVKCITGIWLWKTEEKGILVQFGYDHHFIPLDEVFTTNP